jgi:hypothetical protein
MMSEYRRPTVDEHLVRIAQDDLGDVEDVRAVLQELVKQIPDDLLMDVRGIQVFLRK